MTDINRVSVKIFGQEYTILGEKPREHIVRTADHVDKTMTDIADNITPASSLTIATLAAVNIADDFFSQEEDKVEMKLENEQLVRDLAHYTQMWEEAKKNFLQYKEDAQLATAEKEELRRELDKKLMESKNEESLISQKDNHIRELESKIEKLESSINDQKAGEKSGLEKVEELEAKCKEIEGNYFDLQMENIQLKGEIDRYKKIIEADE